MEVRISALSMVVSLYHLRSIQIVNLFLSPATPGLLRLLRPRVRGPVFAESPGLAPGSFQISGLKFCSTP